MHTNRKSKANCTDIVIRDHEYKMCPSDCNLYWKIIKKISKYEDLETNSQKCGT